MPSTDCLRSGLRTAIAIIGAISDLAPSLAAALRRFGGRGIHADAAQAHVGEVGLGKGEVLTLNWSWIVRSLILLKR